MEVKDDVEDNSPITSVYGLKEVEAARVWVRLGFDVMSRGQTASFGPRGDTTAIALIPVTSWSVVEIEFKYGGLLQLNVVGPDVQHLFNRSWTPLTPFQSRASRNVAV